MGLFPKKITVDQAKDVGMVMVLICLITEYFSEYAFLIPASIILMLIDIVWPKLFMPFARIWFGISAMLGQVSSRIILGVVYSLMVTPMGIVRRLMGKDSMQLKKWKNGTASVFLIRDHAYGPEEIEKPY